jgi:hypothetical protein
VTDRQDLECLKRLDGDLAMKDLCRINAGKDFDDNDASGVEDDDGSNDEDADDVDDKDDDNKDEDE